VQCPPFFEFELEREGNLTYKLLLKCTSLLVWFTMQATANTPTRALSLSERLKAIAAKRTLRATHAADALNSGLIPVLPKDATVEKPTPAARKRLGAGSARAAAMVAAAIAVAETKHNWRVAKEHHSDDDANSHETDCSEDSDAPASIARVRKQLVSTFDKEDLLPLHNKRKQKAGPIPPGAKLALKDLRAKRSKKPLSRSPSPPSPYNGILTSIL
jgi:hypothetical protein